MLSIFTSITQEHKTALVTSAATITAVAILARHLSSSSKAASKLKASKATPQVPILIAGLFQTKSFPIASPFVQKLAAVFRAAKFPVSVEGMPNCPPTKSRKVPGLYYKGETLEDSELIVKRLVADGVIAQHPNAWLDPVTKANAEMFRLSIENFIYYRLGKERWIDHFDKTMREYLGALKGLFFLFVYSILRFTVRPGIVDTSYRLGITRYSEEAWVDMETQFWNNASAILGDKKYFFSNERMCMADYSAFGTLANVIELPELTPKLNAAVIRHENLVAFVARVKKELYPELC
ncbi:UNVERIFIED_CONTAM: hypothetical protein HDU68_008987 [Siphonaria sp. JEL0065]|nr:hypothetical protein HDU68_008984 [Siphonaria sp. JEL0065]KAJ3022687.1 hypothetical protein HDU68_008987 [Siphonaria sp. JEL0065]